MFGDHFQHFLTYGATDQQTFRELSEKYTGVIVPGTIAAFQRDGTGGFVLTLSATTVSPPYVIDPRFPLFQQPLPSKKKSHIALAELLGDTNLVSAAAPSPSFFSDEKIDHIAKSWVQFNEGYKDATASKFAKYAKRLNEPVESIRASHPQWVIAPYFIASEPSDEWWKISQKLFDLVKHHSSNANKCVRVVGAYEADALGDLLAAVGDSQCAIWVSDLHELKASAHELRVYRNAIRNERGKKRLFAMYGGFFSVLLSSVGLGGSCHGVGFGEHRDFHELPQSGPPPPRYYLPRAHRYVRVEVASLLYLANPSLAECSCPECKVSDPSDLDYHALMKHSVHCRSAEIDSWVGLDPSQTHDRLESEAQAFLGELSAAIASRKIKAAFIPEVEACGRHFSTWLDALNPDGDN